MRVSSIPTNDVHNKLYIIKMYDNIYIIKLPGNSSTVTFMYSVVCIFNPLFMCLTQYLLSCVCCGSSCALLLLGKKVCRVQQVRLSHVVVYIEGRKIRSLNYVRKWKLMMEGEGGREVIEVEGCKVSSCAQIVLLIHTHLCALYMYLHHTTDVCCNWRRVCKSLI